MELHRQNKEKRLARKEKLNVGSCKENRLQGKVVISRGAIKLKPTWRDQSYIRNKGRRIGTALSNGKQYFREVGKE